MDVLQLALYALASFAALRSLIAMMSGHKARYAQKRWAEVAQNAAANPVQPAIPAKGSKADRSAA